MIRHTVSEGWLLLKERAAISLALAAALAVPVAMAGLTWAASGWLGPLLSRPGRQPMVAVLLRPELSADAQQQWLSEQRERHPQWRVEPVAPGELAERLRRWFPYLAGLLAHDAVQLLPPLVEVGAPDPAGVAALDRDPRVLAVGPRSSLHLLLHGVATKVTWLLGVISAVLLTAATLLAAVWVHLELYRHGDEITIMRLVGATEAAIRGPFLLAVAVPGLLAGGLAVGGTLAAAESLSRPLTRLGLPALTAPGWVLAGEVVAALALPLLAAMITLARHASLELED